MSKEFYRRRLPHWQLPQATYFVTYRLAGSIPKEVIQHIQSAYHAEVAAARAEVARNSIPGEEGIESAERCSAAHVARNSVPGEEGIENTERSSTTQISPQLQKELATLLKMKQYDAQKRQFKAWDDFLDSNLNEPHWLKQDAIAELNMNSIKFYDGKYYQLLACTILSNHIHLLFNLLPEAPDLGKVMQGLKRYTALHSNRLLGRAGQFWAEESYDHIVRDGEFERILAYLVNNPVKAGLVNKWEDWKWTFCHESLC